MAQAMPFSLSLLSLFVMMISRKMIVFGGVSETPKDKGNLRLVASGDERRWDNDNFSVSLLLIWYQAPTIGRFFWSRDHANNCE